MRKLLTATAALVAVATLTGLATAEPADQFGAAGAALTLQEEPVSEPTTSRDAREARVQVAGTESSGAQLTDEGANPEITTQPVETLPDGTPKYLSQDGGDGEHASVAVSAAMNELVASNGYANWGIRFGETEQSNDTQTVFWVQAGDTRFLLTLEKE